MPLRQPKRHDVCCLLVCLFGVVASNPLTVTNEGYDDLVVAVSLDLPESPELVDNVKDLIQDTSSAVYKATGIPFRRVTILVPSRWQQSGSCEKTTKLSFEEAGIRVEKVHPQHGDTPYTKSTWICGAMQKFVHITPGFVFESGKTNRPERSKGEMVANQFLRFRFGIFDDVIGQSEASYNMSAEHERVCGSVTAFEVIRAHGDYQHSRKSVYTPPEISVVCNENDHPDQEVKVCGRRVVMALDVSDSMKLHERYHRQKQLAARFIEEILPLSTELGILEFDSAARMIFPMSNLTTDDTRNSAVATLPDKKRLGDMTSIGSALSQAVYMLSKDGVSPEGGRIVLITDGEQTAGLEVADVFDSVLESKVCIHSIALGKDADESLATLTQTTGGKYGYFTEKTDSSTLIQVTDNLWSDFNLLCAEDAPIEIEKRAFVFDENHHTAEHTVNIDPNMKTADISLTSSENMDLKVEVTDPKNQKHDEHSPEYRREAHISTVKFTFTDPHPGMYVTEMDFVPDPSHGGVKKQVVMSVKSKPVEESVVIQARSWLKATEVKAPDVNHVFTEIMQGYLPVVKASVVAIIERPGGSLEVTLTDDGTSPDVEALDGVYAAEIAYTDNGRYAVDIRISSVEGETGILDINTGTISLADIFSRKTSPGAFDVHGYDSAKNPFPPSAVTDLHLHEVKDNIITLTWMAPGNNHKQGKGIWTSNLRYAVKISMAGEAVHNLRLITPVRTHHRIVNTNSVFRSGKAIFSAQSHPASFRS